MPSPRHIRPFLRDELQLFGMVVKGAERPRNCGLKSRKTRRTDKRNGEERETKRELSHRQADRNVDAKKSGASTADHLFYLVLVDHLQRARESGRGMAPGNSERQRGPGERSRNLHRALLSGGIDGGGW